MTQKLVPDLFLENQDWAYLWTNSLDIYTICMFKLKTTKLYWYQGADHSLLPHIYIKFFQKTKSGLELVSLPYFLHNVWRKIFIMLYSMNWPNFIAWLSLFLEISGNMYIAIFYFPVCDVINFENNFSFLTKPLPYMTKKVKAKI